jgi:hypothetical protein
MFKDGFIDLRHQFILQQRSINDGSSNHSNGSAMRGASSGGLPPGVGGMWPPPPPPQQLPRPGLPPGMPSVSPFVSARSNTPKPGTGLSPFTMYRGALCAMLASATPFMIPLHLPRRIWMQAAHTLCVLMCLVPQCRAGRGQRHAPGCQPSSQWTAQLQRADAVQPVWWRTGKWPLYNMIAADGSNSLSMWDVSSLQSVKPGNTCACRILRCCVQPAAATLRQRRLAARPRLRCAATAHCIHSSRLGDKPAVKAHTVSMIPHA